jgi:Chaperone of endosialidase
MKTRTHFLVIALTSIFLAIIEPNAPAVVPPPDGGYPNLTTAEGTKALQSLTSGSGNTGIGWVSLFSATTASFNTGVGAGTLALNDANENTATGAGALLSNSSGFQNTANGAFALLFNTTGSFNTAIGNSALYSNLNGIGNTATGASALQSNTTGGFNTAMGNGALLDNTAGSNNTATGTGALAANTMGEGNTASGFQALFNNTDGFFNTAIGAGALINNSGSDNIALGADAGISRTTGSHNIDIGATGVAGESGTIRIGNNIHTTQAFIAGISGVTVPGGVGVIVDINGHLGTNVSSARFKDEIKRMDKASEAILALKPVTFRYKKELDPNGIPQFGLVAEDVAKVNPDLVARDAKGELYTVRYEAVNAMLLNEFLKEHATVQELKKEIAALKAGLQKLSAQIDLGAPPLQTVVNNH